MPAGRPDSWLAECSAKSKKLLMVVVGLPGLDHRLPASNDIRFEFKWKFFGEHRVLGAAEGWFDS